MNRFPSAILLLLFLCSSISCYDWAYYQQQQEATAAASPSASSTTIQDTVYLNDGSIIHGKIIEEVPDSSLRIQTTSGNVFTYQMSDVQKITHARVSAGN